MTQSTPLRIPTPLTLPCQDNPEAWVGEHEQNTSKVTGGHALCRHRYAKHVCLEHCPVQKECQVLATEHSDWFAGTVIGGTWNDGSSDPLARWANDVLVQPVSSCDLC